MNSCKSFRKTQTKESLFMFADRSAIRSESENKKEKTDCEDKDG